MSIVRDNSSESHARGRRAAPKYMALILTIGTLVAGGVWVLRGDPPKSTCGASKGEADGRSIPLANGDVPPRTPPELSPAPTQSGAHARAIAPDGAGAPRDEGSHATQSRFEGSDAPSGPLIARVYAAAKAGRWQDAVRWIDEDLSHAPPGTTRDRLATLRVHLLMAFGSREDGALALALLLSDAASAMVRGRFAVASAPDAIRAPEDCTIFVGPFVVAGPESGWVNGGSSLYRMMRGHALDSGSHDAPYLRTEDAYLASLASFVTSAINDIAKDDAVTRRVLEATRAFIELNERIRREGASRVRTQSTAPLRDDVASFVRTHGSSTDPRVQGFTRFLFQAFPGWASQALHSPPR